MFCTGCGAEIPEGSKFCTACGKPVEASDVTSGEHDTAEEETRVPEPKDGELHASLEPKDGEQESPAGTSGFEAPAAQQPAAVGGADHTVVMPHAAAPTGAGQADPYAAPAPQKRSHTGVIVAVVCAVVAVAVAVGVFLFLGSDSSDGGGNVVINAIKGEPEPVEVPFEVDIPNYDPDSGSLVPVQVTGTDYDDNDVDEVQYVDDDGEGLSLLPGSYELSIAASPFGEDGTLYACPDDKVALDIEEDGSVSMSGAFPLEFKLADALDVTDDDIQRAYDCAVDGGCDTKDQADDLKSAAEKWRDDAVEEENRRAQEEETRRRAEQEEAAYRVTSNYYEFTVPVYWRGRVTWTQSGNTTNIYSSAYPSRKVCSIEVESASSALNMGDIGGGICYYVNNGSQRVTVRMTNYSYIIAYYASLNSSDPSTYYSMDEARELVDLQSMGSYSYDTMLNTYKSTSGHSGTLGQPVSILGDTMADCITLR